MAPSESESSLVRVKCDACNGAGICLGAEQPTGTADRCSKCLGSGFKKATIFTGVKRRDDINTVVQAGELISYGEFLRSRKVTPPTEGRQVKYACPICEATAVTIEPNKKGVAHRCSRCNGNGYLEALLFTGRTQLSDIQWVQINTQKLSYSEFLQK